jgi:tRNA A37 threonylcarbamoyladenosine modification protein TsaB
MSNWKTFGCIKAAKNIKCIHACRNKCYSFCFNQKGKNRETVFNPNELKVSVVHQFSSLKHKKFCPNKLTLSDKRQKEKLIVLYI